MYDDLHNINEQSEHTDDDDIVNNLDDLEHSEVDETPYANNVGDEAEDDAERSETQNKDEESGKVEPKKRRVLNPQPKLNDERLKGPRGIGVIEKMFEDVKLKGKGHEKEDLDLVVGRLEHWAHRLFPKFQFDDCLKRIEKLGTKRAVANYVKRLRMGMEDEIVNEITEPLSPEITSIDPFDELIGQRQEPSLQTAKQPITLTAEQRERMLRNRMLAEERRMARLQAHKERDAQLINTTDEERNGISTHNISECEQTNVSVNSGVQQTKDVPEVSGNEDHTKQRDLGANSPAADPVETEVVESINKEIEASDTVGRLVQEEQSSVDKTNESLVEM